MVANHTVRAQSHMETAVVVLEMTIPAGFYCSSSGGHRHQKRASVMPCLAQAASATTSPWFGQEPSQALVVSPAGLVAPSRWQQAAKQPASSKAGRVLPCSHSASGGLPVSLGFAHVKNLSLTPFRICNGIFHACMQRGITPIICVCPVILWLLLKCHCSKYYSNIYCPTIAFLSNCT